MDGERHEVGDVVLVEGLSVQSQDDIAIVGEVGSSQAQAIAPQILFDFFGGAIGLFLVAALFNAQATIGITFGLSIRIVAFFDVLAQVVLFHMGVDMGHVEGDDLA